TVATSLTPGNSSLTAREGSSASATVLFIFRFPAMISLRSLFIIAGKSAVAVQSPFTHHASRITRSLLCQRRHSWQLVPLKKFETGAAARAHKAHFVAQAGLLEPLHAVPAPNDSPRAFGFRRVDHVAPH